MRLKPARSLVGSGGDHEVRWLNDWRHGALPPVEDPCLRQTRRVESVLFLPRGFRYDREEGQAVFRPVACLLLLPQGYAGMV